MKTKSEKGFTLVEILAALIILGIVFISYMTIFPQMVNINDRTEKKLNTMNVAKRELIELKDYSYENKKMIPELNSANRIKDSKTINDYETYAFDRDKETIIVDCYNADEQKCSGENENPLKRKTELYKVHIQIKVDGKVISETFGYLELD